MGLKIPIRGNKIMRSEPTDTITIRVPNALKEKLEKKIKENQVTLNLLINQILTKEPTVQNEKEIPTWKDFYK